MNICQDRLGTSIGETQNKKDVRFLLQPPMTDEQQEHSDALYRARWLSLLSVDDMVEGLVDTVTKLGELQSTFFMFTSDHGFQLGQFRMPEGKWNAYEHDLRIPMVVSGPGIKAGSSFDFIASNVDTMPTAFGLLGVATPASMDGRSYAHLLVQHLDEARNGLEQQQQQQQQQGQVSSDARLQSPPPAPPALLVASSATDGAAAAWRTEQLIEYGGGGPVMRYEHLEDIHNNTFRCLRVVESSAAATVEAEGGSAPKKTTKNLKLCEFVGWADWNFTSGGADSEWELFDLDADPFGRHLGQFQLV
jgi:hypothetical protein